MGGSKRRLFDSALTLLGLALAAAVLGIGLLPRPTSHMLAMSLATWLMCSMPLAMLMGHCTLSED
jgi:uncharacterized membrane protein